MIFTIYKCVKIFTNFLKKSGTYDRFALKSAPQQQLAQVVYIFAVLSDSGNNPSLVILEKASNNQKEHAREGVTSTFAQTPNNTTFFGVRHRKVPFFDTISYATLLCFGSQVAEMSSVYLIRCLFIRSVSAEFANYDCQLSIDEIKIGILTSTYRLRMKLPNWIEHIERPRWWVSSDAPFDRKFHADSTILSMVPEIEDELQLDSSSANQWLGINENIYQWWGIRNIWRHKNQFHFQAFAFCRWTFQVLFHLSDHNNGGRC